MMGSARAKTFGQLQVDVEASQRSGDWRQKLPNTLAILLSRRLDGRCTRDRGLRDLNSDSLLIFISIAIVRAGGGWNESDQRPAHRGGRHHKLPADRVIKVPLFFGKSLGLQFPAESASSESRLSSVATEFFDMLLQYQKLGARREPRLAPDDLEVT